MSGGDSVTKIKQTNSLIDIWQKENPGKRIFTFHNKHKKLHSRIDRIYIQNKQKIWSVSVIPNNLFDHDAVKITLKIKKANISGARYWKLNTSILKQNTFKKLFKNF